MKSAILLLLLTTLSLFAVSAPPNWGDFQMGLVNNGRTHWDGAMREALEVTEGGKRIYQLDRRYIYMDDTTNMKAYWGTDGVAKNNWSRNSYYESKGVKPAIVIYMLQRGGDSWSAVEAGMNSKEFMKDYFTYIARIADSTRGTNPIYVIEPDVWTYMLQQARENDPGRYTTTGDDWSKIKDNNFESLCHINDLGLPWLTEFENKASNLPGAIIKTLKMRDPGAYAGILIGFWGFQPSVATGIGLFTSNSDAIAVGARETARFTNALLSSTKYRGDFAGLEKNGQDAGYWDGAYKSALTWDDRQNSDWVKFAKSISDSTKLPMVGWQISIGHTGLPNTLNSYEDSFSPYFFKNTKAFMDAGVIGMLAGVAGQDRGTLAVIPGGKTYTNPSFNQTTQGDKGWFYTEYAKFNTARPWVTGAQETYHSVIAEVIPESTFVAGKITDPDWDPTKTYGTADNGKTVHYAGRQYRLDAWYVNPGQKPSDFPKLWTDLGPYGTLTVSEGGYVWNDGIYYKKGSSVAHKVSFFPNEGYGIKSMTLDGAPIDPSEWVNISSITSDHRIKVVFTKGGITPICDDLCAPRALSLGSLLSIQNRSITLNLDATVELFTLNGRKVLKQSLMAGQTVSLQSMAAGTYVASVRVANKQFSTKISIY